MDLINKDFLISGNFLVTMVLILVISVTLLHQRVVHLEEIKTSIQLGEVDRMLVDYERRIEFLEKGASYAK